MSYLLDTNVISELRKGDRAKPSVASWFAGVADEEIFLSVEAHRDRILPVDRPIAEEWGRMNVPDPLPVVAGLLAATARILGLTLVTRNTADVESTGIELFDPFAG